jgi:predicted ATPase
LRAAISLARHWSADGRRPQARQLLLEVYEHFTEGDGTGDLQEARGLLKELQQLL